MDDSPSSFEFIDNVPDEAHETPDTHAVSSPQPASLPWSDSSLTTFLENDTTIKDTVVLIHEGSRFLKKSADTAINPQIAELFSICTIHIEEMTSVIP